jgi:hypothetical protein
MSQIKVFIDDVQQDIISDISIKRSYSNLVSSASFSTPLDLLAEAQAGESVIIRKGALPLFHGVIHPYKFDYQGGSHTLSLDCSDECYKLATTDRISFEEGTKAGAAIVALLAGTTITTTGVALATTDLPDDCFVFPVNSNRLDAVKKISDACGALFYLDFSGSVPEAVCDTWTNLLTSDAFIETVEISDATHLVTAFSLDGDPLDPTVSKASISFIGVPGQLFNKLDLTDLYTDMGITYSVSTWRITDMEIKVSASSISSTYSLVVPTLDLTA